MAERGTRAQIAEMFDVSRRFVDKVVQRYRAGDPPGPKRGHVGQPKIRGAHVDLLRRLVAEQPDATLEDLVHALEASGGPRVSVAGMCLALQRLKLPRKKSRSTR